MSAENATRTMALTNMTGISIINGLDPLIIDRSSSEGR